ncbi:MAG: sodium:glutamate symporter [Spirochaetaceae bacterium]|nr:MAG: sodium:glutamate symporter [Spirochaetaceae bacterium]
MSFHWSIFVHLGVIALSLLLATLVRARVRFFQSFLIPNSLTAGFFLLIFYNTVANYLGIGTEHLGDLIYHLLSLSFIAMGLRNTPERGTGKRVLSTGLMTVASFTFQALLGIALTFLFIALFIPGLSPSFGLFIPLGFEMGPGQAYSIGIGWEEMGFQGAGSIGLTFATMGFLWACFGGVFLINLGMRKGWLGSKYRERLKAARVRSGICASEEEAPAGSQLTTDTEAIDTLSFNLAAVFIVYLLTYLLLKSLSYLLSFAGAEGRELAVNLWGISFIFAALLAVGTKQLFKVLQIDHVLDPGSLTRIAGSSVDILVAAALGAISLVVVLRYWLPILVMALLGGLLTIGYVLWFTSRLFVEHRFQRAMIIYGAATGTLPTGLALLRILDPEFETPAAVDYIYGSGIAFVLVIPYILSINLMMYGHTRGNPLFYWATLGLVLAYLFVFLVLHRVLAGKRAFARPGKIWFPG